MPTAHLSLTHNGEFTLCLFIAKRLAQKLYKYQFYGFWFDTTRIEP